MSRRQGRAKSAVRTLAKSQRNVLQGVRLSCPWSSLYAPSVDQGGLNLCKSGRNVIVVFQSSLDPQADSCSAPHMPETGELRVIFGQGFSKHTRVESTATGQRVAYERRCRELRSPGLLESGMALPLGR